MKKDFSTVGKNFVRKDAFEKATGTAVYACDMDFEGQLYAGVVRSIHPFASILSVDTKEAEAMPGVHAVMTSADIPGGNSIGIIVKDEFVLAEDVVRRIGDAIAIVAAETPEQVREAMEHVNVEYEIREPVFSIWKSLEMDAPKIHTDGNIMINKKFTHGDVDAAFAQCDVIVENRYTTSMLAHMFLETEAGIAFMDKGIMTVYCCTQNPHYCRNELARVLNLPMNKVRVIQTTTGGGFGGKLDVSVQAHIALLAQRTGRPVKMVRSRKESTLVSSKRHPFYIDAKTGATKDGKVLACEVKMVADTGAYASYGPAVASRAIMHFMGPYEVPNIRGECTLVYTNNPVAGAFRGFGMPQAAFCHEGQMNALARALKMDPIELRLKNAHRIGTVTSTGQLLDDSVGFIETLEQARDKAEEVIKKQAGGAFNKKIGKGVGCMWYGIGNTGSPNPSAAFVEVLPDATVNLIIGGADIGQGSSTAIAQIVSEELGLPYDNIHVISADTMVTPEGGATSASRQTFVSGSAAQQAAKQAKASISEVASEYLNVPPGELVFQNGYVCSASNPEIKITYTDLMKVMASEGQIAVGAGSYNPSTKTLDPLTQQGSPYEVYSYATAIAEVEVDTDTGIVTLTNAVSAHDVGTVVNQKMAEGQIEGGVVMGQGFALMEKVEHKNGLITNPVYSKYLIPTSMDTPNIYPLLVETECKTGPFGAKGIGEPALVPIIPAIADAVEDAIGIRFNNLPITPSDVLRALREENNAE